MNTRKLEIIWNSGQLGYQAKRQQTTEWLHNSIPKIMKSREMATSKIFLKATNRITTFCLN